MTQVVIRRFVAILVLLIVLLVSLVGAGTMTPSPTLGDYPGNEELGSDYVDNVGGKVAVAGVVVDTEPTVISLSYADRDGLELTVTNLDFRPDEGDRLRVFGTVRADNTIEAINAFYVPRSGLWYTWAVSFVAGLWVLGRILNHWKIDREQWSLRPRATSSIAERFGEGDGSDA